jgi:hypothetical protein
MNITGYIGTKSKQISAYGDNVAIRIRNKNALKDNLVNMGNEAKTWALLIHENKTKYLEVTRIVVNGDHLRCGKRI